MIQVKEKDAEFETKKKRVRRLLEQNILVSPDFLGVIQASELEDFDSGGEFLVINQDVRALLKENGFGVNWFELERSKALSENLKRPEAYKHFLTAIRDYKHKGSSQYVKTVNVVSTYEGVPKKREVGDFVSYYSSRFKFLQSVLMQRTELQNLVQIDRLRNSPLVENVSIICMVNDFRKSKQGHYILSVEDLSGSVTVIVNKSRKELFSLVSDMVYDVVIGIAGSFRNGAFFASNVVFPGIPFKEPKRSPREEYAVFMSDLHFGSEQFLEADFNRFLKWFNGKLGNSIQREMASKVKYVLVAGDIVDGVGVYQDQYDELSVKDVRAQYKMCADFLSELPDDVSIIISPGNHDAVRAAEPQNPLSPDFASDLTRMPNVTLVSNPAMVNIGSADGFAGFDVLLYHGYSFDYYVANVDSIRLSGGYERADLVMKFLLKCRHLAPAHTSTLILPDSSEDPLCISRVPDIFATGHIHRTSVSDYRGVVLINGSCWQGKTKFQERMGHNPQPSKVPVFNLKNRSVKIINFGK